MKWTQLSDEEEKERVGRRPEPEIEWYASGEVSGEHKYTHCV